MMDCVYPDCESCGFRDCMYCSQSHMHKMLKRRREKAGISCRTCPAYMPSNKEGTGRFYCLVHRKSCSSLGRNNAPSWCTAGCEYTDKKINGIRQIRKILDENAINIDL